MSIVQDGQVLHSRGYGYSDVAHGVDATRETLFRIGSVSKLFIWIAVMQLLEAGEVTLDEDISEYLGSDAPSSSYPPLTLAHLMTHTPGLENLVIGMYGSEPETLRPLQELIRAKVPRAVRPPGAVASYSNYGAALAALVVERLTGVPFESYVEERVLSPVGMLHTTLTQRPEGPAGTETARPYRWLGGVFEEQAYEYVPLAPTGGASSSGDDMAKLMMAFLTRSDEPAGFLTPATRLQMMSPLFRHHEYVNPSLYGLMDMSRDGHRIVGHSGDTLWFHSLLALLPEHGIGIFVSYNTDRAGDAGTTFLRAFLKRFLPNVPPPPIEVPAGAAERANAFVGAYMVTRYSHSDFTKIGATAGVIRVTQGGDGSLKTDVTGDARLIEIAPDAYRDEGGHRRIAFRRDANGDVTHMFFDPYQVNAFERLRGWETPRFQAVVLCFNVLVFVLALILYPVKWIRRSRRGPESRGAGGAVPKPVNLIAWLAALGFLSFIVSLLLAANEPSLVALGELGAMKRTLWVGLFAAGFGGLSVAGAVWVWVRRRGSLWDRARCTALGLACALSILLMQYWNLLGLRY